MSNVATSKSASAFSANPLRPLRLSTDAPQQTVRFSDQMQIEYGYFHRLYASMMQ
jgi:hypothetical protein